MTDRPLKRKYSRIERERRFLLDQLPSTVHEGEYERLHDCYLEGTNLRLRRVEDPSGKFVIAKLGQKMIDPEYNNSSCHRQMTTIYLSKEEETVIAKLPGKRSVKRRYKAQEQGWTFVIDIYEAPASATGKMLCEVECDTDEQLAKIQLPRWAVNEITEDANWSGFNLAN